MHVRFIQPRKELRPFVRSIWVFESHVGMAGQALNMAVPNGCPKLIVNCENSLVSRAEGRDHETKEHSFSFVGIRDVPVSLFTTRSRMTRFIGVELTPSGAFPIVMTPMSELTNRLVEAEAISPEWNGSFADRIWNSGTAAEQVDVIQDKLVAAVRQGGAPNSVVQYCVDVFQKTHGATTIADLERRTGYDRRSLEILFRKHVGVSPKTLAMIFRFSRLHRQLANGKPYMMWSEELYGDYYDQAHFIKDFKKMTGYTPKYYHSNVPNEFGRLVSGA